jgi:hypothetical protein
MSERARFVVTFTAAPGVDGVRALRALLKAAGRRFGLTATDAREQPAISPHAATQFAGALGRLSHDVRARLRHEHPPGVCPPRRAGSDQAAGATPMSLGKRKSSDFMPIAKYDARAGTIFLQDRVLGPNGYETEQRDVTEGFRAIFDLEQVERGWIYYPKGAPPNLIMVPAGEDPGEAPSKDHKEGIRLTLKMLSVAGDSVRELQSTSLAMWAAVDALHTAWANQAADHPNEVPIVELTDVIETKTPNGSSFTPVFEIDGWVPRPIDMPKVPPGLRKPAKPTQASRKTRDDLDSKIPF